MDDEKENKGPVLLPEQPEPETEPEREPESESEPEANQEQEPDAEDPEAWEDEPDTPEEDMPGSVDQDRRERLRWMLAGVVTLLLMAGALGVFIFRDRLSEQSLRTMFGQGQETELHNEAFTYELGANQVFARAGSGFAVASSSAIELLNGAGETVFKQVVSLSSPAVFGAERRALFCDLGGSTCVLADMDGQSVALDAGNALLTGCISDNGWCAAVTATPGYKGLVSVFNAAGDLKFQWWSGSGYVLRVALSPDSRMLAVLCAENGGGRLHLFRVDSEAEAASVWFPGELPFEMGFVSADAVALLSEKNLSFFNTDGSPRGAYPLAQEYLLDYNLNGTGFAALYTGSYEGGGSRLVTVDSEGKVLGEQETGGDLVCLSACGRSLLTLSSGGVMIYAQDLTVQYRRERMMTVKNAILCPDRHYLLLSSSAAERVGY